MVTALRYSALLLLTAGLAAAQFLEFVVRFDDGGCISCAESLESRMKRVRGVESAALDLDRGVIRLKLAADNRVRLVPLMSRIEQGGAKALDTKITARGFLRADGGVLKLELSGSATGQVYILEGDAGAVGGLATVETQLIEAADHRLRILSTSAAE